jgi:toxin YoeB
MVAWQIVYTKQSLKDFKKISRTPLKKNVKILLDILTLDPFKNPPPFKKLTGDFIGLYSRRINLQHRLVYQLSPESKVIKVVSMWTHYE